jgi:predicted RecA/RadA family phage recombinase
MQATFVHEGHSIDYTPGADIAVGDVVVFGKVCCVAKFPIASGKDGALSTRGVYSVAKATPLAMAVGDALYWNSSSKQLTKTTTDTYFGICVAAAAANDTTVKAQLRSLQDVVSKQLGLADLSDVHTATLTNGFVLTADGTAFHSGPLQVASLPTVADGEAGVPFVIRKTVTAGTAGDQTVATAGRKLYVIGAICIARDTNAANVKLHSGTAGTDDITEAIAKGTADDAVIRWAKLIAEKQEVASGGTIKCNFSAAGSVEVILTVVPVA